MDNNETDLENQIEDETNTLETDSDLSDFETDSEIVRPDAPKSLSEQGRKVWDRVVERMPADWFPAETHGELTAYCEHTASAEYLQHMIQQFIGTHSTEAMLIDPDLIKNLDKLYKMHERETRAASSQATRLRITNQSLRSDKSKKPAMIEEVMPWNE